MSSNSKSSSGHHRSHRDPSEGGWDTSIVKAPDSHKSSKHKHRRKRHKKWPKVVAGIVIGVLVLCGIGAGIVYAYMHSINSAMSLGDDADAIESALTDTPATKPFYVLVMGSDMREVTDSSVTDGTAYTQKWGSRSDVIMLMRVDATNSKLTMLSIPRDTPYYLEDGQIVKLNHAYAAGGATQLIDAVQNLTGVKISHYVEVSGSELENLVDGLGGITVNVPHSINATTITGVPVNIEAGLQHLNGSQALAVAGQRMMYETDQEMNRQSAARLVVAGIIDAIRSKSIAEIPGAVSQAASCVKTDMDTSELINLVQMMSDNLVIYSGTGPYKGDLDAWAVASHNRYDAPWLCYVNNAGWQRVIALVDAGDDPSGVSYTSDSVYHAGQPENTWSQGPIDPQNVTG